MNTEVDSGHLLAEFARTGSESAFSELLRRHIDLVYSAARRRCAGDTALAEDVAQTVFADLARKAPSLPRDVVPAGWLYRHTCFVAATAVRTEVRRRNREETAAAMNQDHSAPDWSRVAPVLDDAMLELADRDRDALVLRYFEEEPFGRVGAALGVSEDAARMRVERALDRLRELLTRRGVTSAGGALAATLSANAVLPAPAGLVATVAGTVEIAPIAAATSWWSMKTALACASVAVATVALVGAFHLRREVAQLRAAAEADRAAAMEALRQTKAPQIDAGVENSDELARLRAEHLELLRLRGEVARLRRELGAMTATVSPEPPPRSETVEDEPKRPTQLTVDARIVLLTDAATRSFGLKTGVGGRGVLSESEAETLIRSVEQTPGAKLVAMPKITTLDARQARMTLSAGNFGASTDADASDPAYVIDVLPVVDVRNKQIVLSIDAGVAPRNPSDARMTVVVKDGQSAVWTQPATGPLLRSAAGNAAGFRHIMIIVGAACIDPAGNRLFSGENAETPPAEVAPAASAPALPDR